MIKLAAQVGIFIFLASVTYASTIEHRAKQLCGQHHLCGEDAYEPYTKADISKSKLGLYHMDIGPPDLLKLQIPTTIRNYDHGLVYQSGRLMIFKECPVDVKQDPVENACQTIWAYI